MINHLWKVQTPTCHLSTGTHHDIAHRVLTPPTQASFGVRRWKIQVLPIRFVLPTFQWES